MKKILLSGILTVMIFSIFSQVEVGRTKYDLQTNNSPQRRIAVHPTSGEIVLGFTCSHNGSFADRGTGYNYSTDNGTTWTNGPTEFAAPFVRPDLDRTGWPDVAITGDKEIFISHYSGGSESGISVLRRDLGTTTWSQTSLNATIATNATNGPLYANAATWARMAVKGDSIIIITGLFQTDMPGMTGGMQMWRSTDGGDNWNGPDDVPLMNSTNFLRNGGDNYAIDVNENGKIAIVLGSFQVEVLTSTDWGDTFTKQTVVAVKDNSGTPIPLFDGEIGQTMDTVNTSDGSYSVVVDDNDMVHVWFGRTRNFKYESTTEGTSFLPLAVGLMYWNDGMTDATLLSETEFTAQQVGLCDPFFTSQVFSSTSGFGPQINLYFPSLTSHPSGGYDENGNIFVAYSGMVPATFDDVSDPTSPTGVNNISPDAFHYRDIYIMKSSDDGATWDGPFNVSNAPLKECVFTGVPRKIYGTDVPVLWQQDDLPGTNLQEASAGISHPIIDNNIMFMNVSIASIVDPIDVTAPLLGLIGLDTLSVIISGSYTDPGYLVESSCNEIADTTITNNVNTAIPGVYTIVYLITDIHGNQVEVTRYVTVIAVDDVAPAIDITGGANITVEACSTWSDEGATAFDNIDFDLTSSISTSGTVDLTTLGSYTITYSVTDVAGNLASANRIVTVVDTEGPTITFDPDAVIYICKGGSFVAPNVSFSDCFNASVTISDDASATLGANSGIFTVTYTAIDGSGNSSDKALTVKVGESPVPNFTDNYFGGELHLYGSSTPSATSWAWAFGDGNTASTQNPTHTYDAPGNYDVTLSVTNEYTDVCGSDNGSITKSVVISGLKEVSALNASVNISPNPSNGIINVNLSQENLTNVQVSIYNEIGDLIIEETIKNTSINNTLSIDLGDNASGIYFVNITTDKASVSKKVVVR